MVGESGAGCAAGQIRVQPLQGFRALGPGKRHDRCQEAIGVEAFDALLGQLLDLVSHERQQVFHERASLMK